MHFRQSENMEYYSNLVTAISLPTKRYHSIQLFRIADKMVTKEEFNASVAKLKKEFDASVAKLATKDEITKLIDRLDESLKANRK